MSEKYTEMAALNNKIEQLLTKCNDDEFIEFFYILKNTINVYSLRLKSIKKGVEK